MPKPKKISVIFVIQHSLKCGDKKSFVSIKTDKYSYFIIGGSERLLDDYLFVVSQLRDIFLKSKIKFDVVYNQLTFDFIESLLFLPFV